MAGWGVVADGGAECKVQMGEVVEVRVVQVDMGECAGFWGEGGTGGWGGGKVGACTHNPVSRRPAGGR